MIHQALFPFRQYSLPIAKKIGIPGSAYLQLIMEKYGTREFSLSLNDLHSIGCFDLSAQTSLISNLIIIKVEDKWKVNQERVDELLEITYETSDKRLSNKDLMETIRRFIRHLKGKGKNTTVENILSSTVDFEDDELIDSLSYAIHNGHVTFHKRSVKKNIHENGSKRGEVGTLTSGDSERDYSSLLKKKSREE